jgi:CARDB
MKFHRSLRLGLAVCAMLYIGSWERGHTETVTLYSTADAFVHQGVPNENWGDSPSLTFGMDTTSQWMDAYFLFDLSSIPNGSVINDAYIRLYRVTTSGSFLTCVQAANGGWSENTVTWANGPLGYTDPHTNQTLTGSTGWVNIYLPEIVDDWVNGGRTNQGFIVHGRPPDAPDANADDAVVVYSREGANSPQLVVDYSTSNPIHLISPNGGEVYTRGQTQNITWTPGSGANVQIDLWKGGGFWTTLVASTPNDGSWPWFVDVETQGTDYRVRVADGSGNDVSDSYFTIQPCLLPSMPISPSPYNGATNRSISTDVSWSNGGGATSYDVYFGTDSSPDSGESRGNQTSTSYNPGTLAYSTTYHWRIDAVNSAGTTTGDVWHFTTQAEPITLPSKPTNPSPSNGATNQSRYTDVSWSNGGGATSYNVYFGTDPTPDSGESKGNRTSTSYNPGTLAYSTTYHWRIDAVNSAGTTTGDVWHFTTQAEPVTPPSKPISPSPYNGATNQSRYTDVSWSNGGGATSYNVYFGTDPTPDSGESKGNRTSASYDPGTLAHSTTYHWRIDAVNSTGTTTGDVWHFTTQAEPVTPPSKPISPSPYNGATGRSTSTDISWSNGGGATSYNVYFGTDSSPDSGEYRGNRTSTSYDPGTLSAGTTYHWRIDAVNSAGTTTGDVWHFTVGGVTKPDLTDRGESYRSFSPTSVSAGDTLEIHCDISNIGNASSGTFRVWFYLSTDTSINTLDYALGEKWMSSIAAGGWANCDWSVSVPSGVTPGDYYVGWLIIATEDSNTFNNSACKTGYRLQVGSGDPCQEYDQLASLYYQDFFNRIPAGGEHLGWGDGMCTGQRSVEETAQMFMYSSEFYLTTDFVCRATMGMFNDNSTFDWRADHPAVPAGYRVPTIGEINSWNQRMRQGEWQRDVVEELALSAEFSQRNGTSFYGMSNSSWACWLITHVMAQPCTSSLRAQIENRLGTTSRIDLAFETLNSPDTWMNLRRANIVTLLYLALLRRSEIRPDEIGGWVGEVNRGRSELHLIFGFVWSQEFANRLCDLGIVIPGMSGWCNTGTAAAATAARGEPQDLSNERLLMISDLIADSDPGLGLIDAFEEDGPETPAPLSTDRPLLRTLIPATDVDWVEFTLEEETSIQLLVSGANSDLGVTLLRVDGDSWEYLADAAGESVMIGPEEPLIAGTYLVVVEDLGNDDEVPSYGLTLVTGTCLTCGDD